MRSAVLGTMLAMTCAALSAGETQGNPVALKTWPAGKSYKLKDITVHLSAPVLVAKKRATLGNHATDTDASGSYLWYPQVAKLSNGEIVAIIREAADNIEVDAISPIGFAWSSDGGLNWSPVKSCNKGQGYLNILDHNGDLLHLPFILYNGEGGKVVGPLNVIHKGKREVELIENGVEISGWPRKPVIQEFFPEYDKKSSIKRNVAGFYFNGQNVLARDGKTFLAALYGTFEGDKRCRILCAESPDGRKWTIRSTVVDSSCDINDQGWSNSENAIVRLADGKLMCVFRVEGLTYGQCFSDDDAKTWSKPVSTKLSGHAEPSLVVMKEGAVVLSGGRPGLNLWFNADGKGTGWQAIDTMAHHNEFAPAGERFNPTGKGHPFTALATSSYTEIIALDASNVLYIYDCYTKDGNFGIFVQRAMIERPR